MPFGFNILPASAGPLGVALLSVQRHFLWAGIFSAMLNILFLAPTLYMLQIYDRVIPSRGGTTLLFLTLVLLLALGTLSLLDYIRSRLLVRASLRLDRKLSGSILDTLISQPGGARDTMNKQAMREFDTLRQTLTGAGILALFDAPWSPIYILICVLIHPWLGVVAAVGALLILAIAWANERMTKAPLQRANEAANRSYVSQEQTAIHAEVIRALGMRRAAIGRHLAERDEMMSLQAQASFAGGGFAAASRFLRTSLQSLALGLGALLAIGDQISVGAVFAASFLLGRALAPMDQLVAAWRSMIQARGAYRTIEKLLSCNSADGEKMQLPDPQGRVEVQNCTILNRTKDAAILADISLAMNSGEVLAVVGPSGAGKSTLARAIAGAIELDRGCIRIDGANRADWDQDQLGRHIGYLPQEASLFAGTVKDNIARLATGTSTDVDSAVVAAAQACGAHEMILRLPNGYDTMLSWGGGGLSAGQAQRIALARAIYEEPSLLILDEPNAHLDADGEASLLETLQAAKARGAAVILIAHRMGIMSVVDRIMVVSNGRIEAIGPRDEILEKLKGSNVRSVPLTQRAAR